MTYLVSATDEKEHSREGTLPILRHEQGQCPDPGVQRPRPIPVAVPGPRLGALVRLGTHVRRHLGFQQTLQRPFDQCLKEVTGIQQRALQSILSVRTMGRVSLWPIMHTMFAAKVHTGFAAKVHRVAGARGSAPAAYLRGEGRRADGEQENCNHGHQRAAVTGQSEGALRFQLRKSRAPRSNPAPAAWVSKTAL